ncbi:vegetative incompatibility protein HET-E-1, partial [Elaphomyces granulatus]
WDLNTHSLSCTLTGHGYISCVTFSPPEVRLLACGDRDSTVLIWNLDRPAFCKTLIGHYGYLSCLAFSPDGRLLASARDKKDRIYDCIV